MACRQRDRTKPMKPSVVISFAIVLFLSLSIDIAQAGGQSVGNGGFAVRCLKSDVLYPTSERDFKSIELLEFFQIRHGLPIAKKWLSPNNQYSVRLGPKELSIQGKLDLALARLATIDAKYSGHLKRITRAVLKK